jgi:lycopene beta-cyclase
MNSVNADPGRTPRAHGDVDVDLVVIGDGPAGMALGAHAALLGMRVAVVGPGVEWTATYGVWVDEISADPILGPQLGGVLRSINDRILVWGHRRHELARRYGVINNFALRSLLQARLAESGGRHLRAGVTDVINRVEHSVVVTTEGEISSRWVCDAAGTQRWRPGPIAQRRSASVRAWQTAYGIELEHLPANAAISTDFPTLMDFRVPPGEHSEDLGVPTFCYVIPTAHGWLVEETVLAAKVPVEPNRLRSRLIARLGPIGADLVQEAEQRDRVERVRIPMGGPLSVTGERPFAFGAAAGMIHPATGYSVTASLRAAPRVARALTQGVDPWNTIWSRPARITRRMHQYGAEVLLGMSQSDIAEFFDVFFELPSARWQAYLRVDSSPRELAGAMAEVFRAASAPTRRLLMTADPRSLRLT